MITNILPPFCGSQCTLLSAEIFQCAFIAK